MQVEHYRPTTALYLGAVREAAISRGTKQLPPKNVDDGAKALFAEALLFAGTITVGVYGPNLQLVTLLRWLDTANVDRLIREGALRFSFAVGNFAYVDSGNAEKIGDRPGLRLIRGVGSAWENAYDSAAVALREQTVLSPRMIHLISKLVADNTQNLNDKNLHHLARELAKTDAMSNIGRYMGFPCDADLDSGNLESSLVPKYLEIAHANASILMAACSGCNDMIESNTCSLVISERLNRVLSDVSTSSSRFRTILDFEDMPDLYETLSSGAATVGTFLKLRNTHDGERFRAWLAELKTEDKVGTIREYTSWLTQKVPSVRSKVLKCIWYSGIDAALSFVNPLISISAGTAINMYQELLRDKLLGGWSPRLFIDRIRGRIS